MIFRCRLEILQFTQPSLNLAFQVIHLVLPGCRHGEVWGSRPQWPLDYIEQSIEVLDVCFDGEESAVSMLLAPDALVLAVVKGCGM